MITFNVIVIDYIVQWRSWSVGCPGRLLSFGAPDAHENICCTVTAS